MGLPRKIGVSGAVMLAFGVTFGFIVFPYMLKLQVLEVSQFWRCNVIYKRER